MDALVSRLCPDVAAVEAPFQGASARAALQLAHARGVILAVLANHRIEVVEYAPATVTKSVAGSGRADKEQVGHVVRQLLGSAVSPGHDASDALAIGLCHLAAGTWRRVVAGSVASKRVKRPAQSGDPTDVAGP
jgi:crossover junction endodeoxyribonuclease RuvC